jgi:hypothetical protein
MVHVIFITPIVGGVVEARSATAPFNAAVAVKSASRKVSLAALDGSNVSAARGDFADLPLRRPEFTRLVTIDTGLPSDGDVVEPRFIPHGDSPDPGRHVSSDSRDQASRKRG